MQFRDDSRGQAIQIGAVLLLGALVLAFSLYQATVVPDQNREVEFKHSQEVQGELQTLRNAFVSTLDGVGVGSVAVDLGTQYPSRLLALNPSSPSGVLATVGTEQQTVNATLGNVTASGETGDFWTGTEQVYNTGAVVFRPGYNEYQRAPDTWFEHSVLYNRFRDAVLSLTGQRLVDGQRLSLVTLNGSYYASRSGDASLDIRPVSASTTTVPVTNVAGSSVTLTLPTRLPEDKWRSLLETEFTPQGHVVSLSTTPVAGSDFRLLTVSLEQGVTYELQLSRAGVGTGVVNPGPAYLTDTDGDGSTVPESGTTTLAVQVRDAFNNPVVGTGLTASTSRSDSSVTLSSSTSGSNGKVTLTYDAPDDISGVSQATDTVTAELSGTAIDGFANATVDLTVRVDNSDGSGLSSGAYDVAWEFSTIETETGVRDCFASNDTCLYDLGQDTDGKFDATMNTTAPTTGAFVDFTQGGSIVTLNPGETSTGSNGKAVTEVDTGKSTGTTELTASTTEDSDTMTIKVVDSGSNQGGGPDNPGGGPDNPGGGP